MFEQVETLIEQQEVFHREIMPRCPEALDYALRYAARAHGYNFQTRKYTGEPYIVHPINVARLVAEVFPDVDMIAAAYLHDVVEDTPISQQDIDTDFGFRIARYVRGLTDQFTDPATCGNRATRKTLELQRLSMESFEVQTIKVADMCDNACTIFKHDPNFSKVFAQEKARLLDALTLAHPQLTELGRTMLANRDAL